MRILNKLFIPLFLFVLMLLTMVLTSCSEEENQNDVPNIIVILADDLGVGDVGIYNISSTIPTPNINSLAKNGARFEDAHTNAAVCTPTRYGLLTGRYTWRSRLKSGVLNGFSIHLIESNRLTLASMLKAKGYYTGCVGKWHLGLDWVKTGDGPDQVDYTQPIQNGPNSFGFDYFYGIVASLDMSPYVYIENDRVTQQPTELKSRSEFPVFIREGVKAPDFNFEDAGFHLLEKAQNFIRENAKTENPFFLYFPLTSPHKPVIPAELVKGKTGLGPYGDFIMQTDILVGGVMQVLEEQGISDNTLFILTSDNGSFMYKLDDSLENEHVSDASIQGYKPSHHRSSYIYRGTKADIWEGGHRVPFIVRWPEKIKSATVIGQPICITDMMATLAEVVDYSLPEDAGEDSYSFWPLLSQESQYMARPPILHHSSRGMFAMRDEKWKLVLGNGSGGREKPRGEPWGEPYQLFDMENDPRESTNLHDEYPEVVEKLTNLTKRYIDQGHSCK